MWPSNRFAMGHYYLVYRWTTGLFFIGRQSEPPTWTWSGVFRCHCFELVTLHGNAIMFNIFFIWRSEDFVVPEEPGADRLGRPVSSNREAPERKASPQTGGAGWKGNVINYTELWCCSCNDCSCYQHHYYVVEAFHERKMVWFRSVCVCV